MHAVKPTSSTLSNSEGVPPTEIQNLPPELLLQIFKDLKPSEALNARTVCSGWNILLIDPHLWKGFFARNFPGLVSSLPIDTDYREAYKKIHLHSNLANEVCKRRLPALKGHRSRVTDLVCTDEKLFSASTGNMIKIWDVKTGAWIADLKGHKDGVSSLLYVNGTLISSSFDQTIRFWDVKKAACTKSLAGHNPGFTSLCHANDRLFLGDYEGNILSFVFKTSEAENLPKMDMDEITCLAFGNSRLYIGSWGGTAIKIFDIDTRKYLQPLLGHDKSVTSLVFSEGKLISGSIDGTIKIWDVESGECLHTFKEESPVISLTLAEDYLFSGSSDGTIRIWSMILKKCLHTLELPNELQKEQCRSVSSLSYNNEVLIAGYESGAIYLFDLNKNTSSKQETESA